MEEAKREAETSLSKFSYALDQLEQALRPVLQAIDELRASGNEDDLDPMSRARMHISLSYAVNSLFCMYLRTQGVDPSTHPVSDDIGRVQDAFMSMRKVEAGLSADHQPAPDRDRRRYIVNAKKSVQKLASRVFPEEVDLLNAIRGKKRKRETVQDENAKKPRKIEEHLREHLESESDSDDDYGKHDISNPDSQRGNGKAFQTLSNAAAASGGKTKRNNKNISTSRKHDATNLSSSEGEPDVEMRPNLSSDADASDRKKRKKKREKEADADVLKKTSKHKKDKTGSKSKTSEEKRKRKKSKEEKRGLKPRG